MPRSDADGGADTAPRARPWPAALRPFRPLVAVGVRAFWVLQAIVWRPEKELGKLVELLRCFRKRRVWVVHPEDPARLYWSLRSHVYHAIGVRSDRAVRTLMPPSRKDAIDIEWLAFPGAPTHRIALTERRGQLALLERGDDGAWCELRRSADVGPLVEVAAQRVVSGAAREHEARLPALADAPVVRPEDRIFHVDWADRWSSSLHRSGWEYAMATLMALHDPDGVLLEGFAESVFLWGERAHGPITRPWVCFIHNPPNTPEWTGVTNRHLMAAPAWRESLPFLRGVFVLSEYHATALRPALDVPVSVVMHPVGDRGLPFDPDRFRANERRALIQIGTWLRRPDSLYRLETAIRRVRLDVGWPWEAKTAAALGITMPPPGNVEVWPRMSNEDYDAALTENVVFLDLIDSSANNAILECVARGTPVLVNRLPPVEEYLGRDYPLLFDDLADASRMADDMTRILDAHEYLRALDGTRFSPAGFIAQVADSEVASAIARGV